jgi:hypothetical protein
MRAAIAALVLALLFAGWSLAEALRDPIVPVGATRREASPSLKAPPLPGAVDVGATVDADLFSPDRSAPSEPFRMPGESAPQAVVQTTPRPTVLGTAVSPNGYSFATAALGSSAARIVREGDKLGDFTVRTIERGHVVFTTSSGTRLDIAAIAAPTQGPSNAPITQTTVAPDTGFGSTMSGRRAARGRGRPARDTVPPE